MKTAPEAAPRSASACPWPTHKKTEDLKQHGSNTGCGRRNRHPGTAVGNPGGRGTSHLAGGKRHGRPPPAGREAPGPGAAGYLDARHRRYFPAQGMGRLGPADHAGGDDVRPRHHRHRGGSHPPRRRGIPGKAHCPAEAPGHGEEGLEARRPDRQAAPDPGRPGQAAPAQGPEEAPGAGGQERPGAAAQGRRRRHRRHLRPHPAGAPCALARPGRRIRAPDPGTSATGFRRHPLRAGPGGPGQAAADEPGLRSGAPGEVQAATGGGLPQAAPILARSRLGCGSGSPSRRGLGGPAPAFRPCRRGAGNRRPAAFPPDGAGRSPGPPFLQRRPQRPAHAPLERRWLGRAAGRGEKPGPHRPGGGNQRRGRGRPAPHHRRRGRQHAPGAPFLPAPAGSPGRLRETLFRTRPAPGRGQHDPGLGTFRGGAHLYRKLKQLGVSTGKRGGEG